MLVRIVSSIVLALVLVLSSIGCMADDSVTTAQFTSLQNTVNGLVAKQSIWDSYGVSIANLQKTATAPPTVDLAPINASITALQTAKDADEKKIKDLEDAVALLKKSPTIGSGYQNPSTPNNPIPNLGANQWQYGTYQIFNTTGGSSTAYIFFNGATVTQVWQLIVTNTSAGPLYISPQVLFTTNQSSCRLYWDNTVSGNGINGIKISPNGWSTSLGLNISPGCSWKTGDATPVDPTYTGTTTATNTLTVMPNSGGTNGGGVFVGSGQSQTWYITTCIGTASGNTGPWTLNITPIGWWTQ